MPFGLGFRMKYEVGLEVGVRAWTKFGQWLDLDMGSVLSAGSGHKVSLMFC